MDKNPVPLNPARQVLPLPDDELGSFAFWQAEVQASVDRRLQELTTWKRNVERYQGKRYSLSGFSDSDFIQVNVDYYKTEQKKAQLFFRNPEMVLSPRHPQYAQATPVFQAVLNEYLGPHQTNAKRSVDEVLSDVLCPAGIGWVEVGFEGVPTQVEVPGPMMPAPAAPQPGSVLGLSSPGPTMTPGPPQVKTIVRWPNYYIRRGTPAKLLIPSDFTGSDYNQAAWLGYEFFADSRQLEQGSGSPDQRTGDTFTDDLLLSKPVPGGDRRPGRKGRKIWYRASVFDPAEPNPNKFRLLIWFDGDSSPSVHEDSSWQLFDEEGHFLSGVKGNPIKVLTLRYTSDCPYPQSDCSMSRYQTDELSSVRTLQMLHKKRSVPMRWVDRNRMDPNDITKLVSGEMQSVLPLDGSGDEMIGVVALPTLPRETSTYGDLIETDINKDWALGSVQQGVTEETARTATELTLMQQNADVRLDAERTRVLDWYITIAESLGGLLQLFADDYTYVMSVGPDGLQRLQQWNRQTIAGEYVYSAKPDSAIKTDANVDRKLALDFYQLTANDPYVNRQELVSMLCNKWHIDPARIIIQPKAKGPEPPKLNMSFKADDLVGPAGPLILTILQQSGYQIPPEMVQLSEARMAAMSGNPQAAARALGQPAPPSNVVQMPNTQHGGAAQEQEPLSKHALTATGAGGHR